MKIFITGASGFIGSHLITLLEKNHQIWDLKSDLLEFNNVETELLEFNPDIIVHLGARTEVEHSFYEQTTFSQINYVGTVNLVNAASKLKNLKNFIFASTMEVYGWQPISDIIKENGSIDSIPVFDETTIPNPNAPYSVAKYACEKYLEYAHRSLDLPFTVIRQTNTYGRKDNEFFVVEHIISQMLKNPNAIKLGYDTPYRNFLYIDDLLELWLTIIEKTNKVNKGYIFTIGPNNAIQIRSLADKIAKKLAWQGTIEWNSKPKRPGEIYLLNSGHKLVTKITGWEPKIDLDQGLDKTIEHWKKIVLLTNKDKRYL
jgi:nucleoside-diphosphate-sugar epimerase